MTKHARNRCQYCRLQKCLAMGMRSDSPRVAAAQESRRSSVSTQALVPGSANKRLSPMGGHVESGESLPELGAPRHLTQAENSP